MGKLQKQVHRRSAAHPQRLPEARSVQDQRAGFKRHDDEGCQRDGHDVRRNAVEAGTMEVEQSERH